MATFQNLQDELTLLTNSQITTANIQALINLAHMQEVEAHPWHRRKTNTVIGTIAPYTTGTVTVASGTTTVTGTGTTWTSAMTGQYMRIGNDDALLQFTFVSATSGTLEVAWPGTTQTAVTYRLFPRFYTIASGCEQVLSVKRTQDLLEFTQEGLNRKDPARRATGSPSTVWVPAGRDSTDTYRIELWPFETSANAYVVEYLKGHTDLVAGTDRPLVPSAVLQYKSQYLAAVHLLGKTGDARWSLQSTLALGSYKDELDKALIADRKAYGVIQQIQHAFAGRGLVDSDFIATHDMSD